MTKSARLMLKDQHKKQKRRQEALRSRCIKSDCVCTFDGGQARGKTSVPPR